MGLTVDELLAGAVREQERVQQAEQTDDAHAPNKQSAAPPEQAASAPQDYLADRLGSVDDKMLLAAVVLILAAAYCGRLIGQTAVLRDLVIVVIAYITFRVWHNKQCSRFVALGVDAAVSHRRARMADILFGAVWLVIMLAVWPGQQVKWLLHDCEIAKIVRYHVVLDMIEIHVTDETAWFMVYALASVPLCLALIGMFALAYRRMTQKTRFRPLAVALPVLPCLIGAGVVGWQRAQAALARMPQFGDPQPTISEGYAMGLAIEAAGYHAMLYAAVAVAVLFVMLLVLWRVTHGRVPLASAVMLAAYAILWLPSGALWLDIGYEEFALQPYAVENITIQLGGLITLLMLTVLCAGIALFADSLRRKKE